MSSWREVRSLDNPLLRDIRALQRRPTAYRSLGRIWIEGDHVVAAWASRFTDSTIAVVSEDRVRDEATQEVLRAAAQVVVVPSDVFARFSDLPSPAGIGLVVEVPPNGAIDPKQPTVILDRLQDTGNVGSILRSAAAFGYPQVIALRGTAALWSPKCLRSAAGAHASLKLMEEQDIDVLRALQWPLLVTSSHAAVGLHEGQYTQPVNWVFSHEGQGVSEALWQLSCAQVRIEHTAGQESLNVAAAAAICLYATRRAGQQ